MRITIEFELVELLRAAAPECRARVARYRDE
jgi:hypothetical protein